MHKISSATLSQSMTWKDQLSKKKDFGLIAFLGHNCLFTGSDPLMRPLDARRQLNIKERRRKLTALRYIMFIHICTYILSLTGCSDDVLFTHSDVLQAEPES